MYIPSLNTENSVFLKDTFPMALMVHGAKNNPPHTISDKTSCKVFWKASVKSWLSQAYKLCLCQFKGFQELEEKLFGMSVRTKARSRHSASSEHYEIGTNFEEQQTCDASHSSWHARLVLRGCTFLMRNH
jgi:hypothetical protein